MCNSQGDREFTIEDNVLKGKQISYDDEHISVAEFVLQRLDADPDFVGQIDGVTCEEHTYATMRERSVRCALWMRSQGLRPKNVVVLCCDNNMDFAIACYATLYIGAVCCPLNTQRGTDKSLRIEHLRHRVNVATPKMIFASAVVVADVVQAVHMAGLDVPIITFDYAPGFMNFESVIAEPRIEEVEKFSITPIQSSSEIAFILFSSGTTGPPKGVALSHRAVILLAHQAEAIGMAGNVCLTFAPVEWIDMVESITMTMLLKIPGIVLPLEADRTLCAFVEKLKANWIFVFPISLKDIVQLGTKYDLSSLKRIHFTGYTLPDAYRKAFAEILPEVRLTGGYGLTEACGYITIQSTRSNPGKGGLIAENAQVKVIDPDTGRTLGVNQRGELLLKFACMMSYYYNNPQATAETLDEEGWLHSGDLGYYDENVEVFVIDRLKDVMRLMEEDVCPSEIEAVILSHPGVKEVAVVGKPDPEGLENAVAFVVRAENLCENSEQVTESEIIDLVAASLPKSHHLCAGVKFIDLIPRTPAGKIRRIALRDLVR